MIAFIDTEVNSKTKRIVDIGCVKENGEQFHSDSITQLIKFTKRIDFFVGHNIIKHDIVFLKKTEASRYIQASSCIDTLFLSTLLFPEKPYHALVKDDKLDTDTINNPLNDAINAQKLFIDEIIAFQNLDYDMKDIFYSLLKDVDGFSAFFKHIKYNRKVKNLEDLIYSKFNNRICSNAKIQNIIKDYPIELAYSLAIINTNDVTSLLPPWVLINYSQIESIMNQLRNTPCYQGCHYCNMHLDAKQGLKKFFGYDEFKVYDEVPLQEKAVQSALKNESLIAVFPTGGGKSLTFQLPAIMSRENTRGLTVVISPLQSLMKDQVDNLEDKNITAAVTINGLLDPIQRANAILRVANGSASILYIAPESLRSKTIEKLLLGRHVIRFVIDEAHCFSTWGHDFRVDYLYIGDFIKNIQDKKNQANPIPVSCFTATAKINVIQDIKDYFHTKLGLEMKLFETTSQRKNLKYKVYEVDDVEHKYSLMRNLIEQEACPTIVYASRRNTVETIYAKLISDQFAASYFHGGMENDKKIDEQNKFMKGETQIMVATSAFGMGVDKKDVGCVIHYNISDSLENYVQESGRAGRDEHIEANCYILYHEDDLNKHFELLNHSKLNLKEIQQVWRAIKEMTKLRDTVSQSALEIAKVAGWEDEIYDIQTRVTTAIAALEDSGYLKRGQNSPRVYANSILSKSVIEANSKIEQSELIIGNDQIIAKRIIKKLISSKYKNRGTDEIPEARIDYISDDLGIPKWDVIRVVNLLREIKVLADEKDLYALIKRNTRATAPTKVLNTYLQLIHYVIAKVMEDPTIINIKALNEEAIVNNIDCTVKNLRTVINYLDITKVIDSEKIDRDSIKLTPLKKQTESTVFIEQLGRIAEITLEYLHQKSFDKPEDQSDNLVTFSVIELKNHYDKQKSLLDLSCTIQNIEDALFFMQKIGALHIEGGFMVIYSPLSIERIVKDNYKQYTKTDYIKLENFYKSKMQQIHIVGEYAAKMIDNYQNALKFVEDYFQIQYEDFLNKYFIGSRKKDIEQNMSPARFKQLFGSLTKEQLAVILDKEHKRIAVAAGPGSGKTKLLVHKLASIIYTEDIRQEQLLMLTFSRAAVTEFKQRLYELIGSTAQYIDIKTFHSFCFDILGRVGDIEKTDAIVKEAIGMIQSREIDPSKITKMVLVIDEAQDMNADEYELIKELIEYNENLRIIAVGDDDQNIFEFRGSSSIFFKQLAQEEDAFYELPVNFRSKKNIVDFANIFVRRIGNRLKKTPIRSFTKDLGFIKVTKHLGSNFIVPIVNEIINTQLIGTTCIISRTNEQALHISGLLNKNGLNSRLIQSNDDFNLYHLIEIRSFLDILSKNITSYISEEAWDLSMKQFEIAFSKSSNFDICLIILASFKDSAPKIPYLTDLKEYIYESNLSDFYPASRLLVSTFHKAKGKEFDNVFILFDNFYHLNDQEMRQLYVGLTRAKSFLSIHTNSNIFDNLTLTNLSYIIDESPYEKPERLIYQLSHRDVNLGYFTFVSKNVVNLIAGSKLEFDETQVLKYQGKKVVQFSKKYFEDVISMKENGYRLSDVIVKYIVYWKDKVNNTENLIVLPELTFDYDVSLLSEKPDVDKPVNVEVEEEHKNDES